jgi:hypothetical protein
MLRLLPPHRALHRNRALHGLPGAETQRGRLRYQCSKGARSGTTGWAGMSMPRPVQPLVQGELLGAQIASGQVQTHTRLSMKSRVRAPA